MPRLAQGVRKPEQIALRASARGLAAADEAEFHQGKRLKAKGWRVSTILLQ